MRQWKLGEVCEHGSLGRKCELCERDDEITTLTAQRDELLAACKAMDSELQLLAAQGLSKQKPSLGIVAQLRTAIRNVEGKQC